MVQKPRRVFLDENMPHQIAHSLHVIQSHLNNKENYKIDITSIVDIFGKGALDEKWIPIVGKENGVVITFDQRIQRDRHQRELYKNCGVGMVFLHMPKSGMGFWKQFTNMVDCWPEIKQIITDNTGVFAVRQRGIGNKFEIWSREDQ